MDAIFLFSKTARFIAHSVAWVGYTALMIAHNTAKYPSSSAAKILLIMPLCMAIFYAVWFIVRRADRSRRWLGGLVRLALFYIAGTAIGYGYVYGIAPALGVPIQVPGTTYTHSAFLQNVFLFYARFSFFALAAFLVEKCLTYLREIKWDRARIAELKASSGLLGAHFLGNVLQRYYSRPDDQHRQAEAARQVDDLIQYAMDVQDKDTDTLIPLRREIEHLQTLMALHRVGEPGGPQVTLELPDRLVGYKVPRLTFISAYENILKYGVTDEPANPARMQLKIVGGAYQFRTYNRISTEPLPDRRRASLGLGLVRSRLELMLKDKFTLEYRRQGERFFFHLYVKP